jgi:hypothetical protein
VDGQYCLELAGFQIDVNFSVEILRYWNVGLLRTKSRVSGYSRDNRNCLTVLAMTALLSAKFFKQRCAGSELV